MSITPHNIKDRTDIEDEVAKFLANGGRVTKLKSTENRSTKVNLIKRHLFHQYHHATHAKNLEVPLATIKEYSKRPHSIDDNTLERLWVYFRERDAITVNRR